MEVHKSDFAFSALFIAGAKFPSVESSRLKRFHEIEIDGAPESGIHEHDLTLGTGSSNAEKDQRVKESDGCIWKGESIAPRSARRCL